MVEASVFHILMSESGDSDTHDHELVIVAYNAADAIIVARDLHPSARVTELHETVSLAYISNGITGVS